MAQYKWFFEENGVQTECKPIIEDSTELQYAQESGEIFYRAKLNGALDFRFEFDDIIAKGYNYTHIVVLKRYDENNGNFAEVWRGKFTLTDCEINYDTNTVTVTPETLDRYTTLLEHLEDEYNLIKLKPKRQPVSLTIEPVTQVYSIGSSKITNITTNGYYEQECTAAPQLLDKYFRNGPSDDTYWFDFTYNMPNAVCTLWLQDSNENDIFFYGFFPKNPNSFNLITINDAIVYTYDADTGVKTTLATITAKVWYDGPAQEQTRDTFYEFTYNNETFRLHYETEEVGADVPYDYTIPAGYEFVKARANQLVTRVLLKTDADTIGIGADTFTLHEIKDTDIAPIANYNKILSLDHNVLVTQAEFETDTTEYGLADQGGYFKKYTEGGTYDRPINNSEWCLHSMWIYPLVTGRGLTLPLTTIADCYPLHDVISRLVTKADNSITLPENVANSAFLFGSDNHITPKPFTLLITPRSNIISSYYDTPALNAPITLRVVLNMLKNLFQVYWMINDNNELVIEHISYFDNGLTYTDTTPAVLLDLDTLTHTRTKSVKDFGQNKVKHEKSNMANVLTFSYDDKQTTPFDGYPINCLDAYVQKGQKEEKQIAKFDADVDMILATPNEFSKDGFVILACPYELGVPAYTLTPKFVQAKDVDGDTMTYWLANYDCAIIYVQQYWWRYALPCENININNEDTVAKTTGRYKLQTVEFADTTLLDVIDDVLSCNKVIRTQQGDGHIKTLAIKLNALSAKADLLFNFIGRWYYLRGTALNGTITIDVNGETKTINVSNNTFIYKYSDMITALDFNGSDVVSVDFTDTDKLENLTSCDDMFKNCTELLSVNFGGKRFAAVTTANDMFYGCSQLTTLDCPDTSTWKPDIDLSDCPNLTTESYYSLIRFLYDYDSGVHTITPNSTFWNNLTADVQTDITTKAQAKGWQINMPALYSISGTSGGNTVYVTINGVALELDSTGGTWQYDYNTPITSLSFENDADVVDIDFSNSDGLAGLTSLANTFKGCSGLTTVDFTNCDLTNVTNAADCFSGCGALYSVTIPSGTWKPDVDLSASNSLMYGEMLNFVSGLYTYTSGTHTIIFNSTIWGNMTEAEQTNVFNACAAKEWTCNAVQPTYYIRGTSSNVGNNETFNIQFIQDGAQTPDAAETITCAVDSNGDWEYSYSGKKIYSLNYFANTANSANTTLLSLDFSASDDMNEIITMHSAFWRCTNLNSIIFGNNQQINNCTNINRCFAQCSSLTNNSIVWGGVTFNSVVTAHSSGNINEAGLFQGCTSITSISLPFTFQSLLSGANMFRGCTNLTSVTLPNAQLANITDMRRAFYGCSALSTVNLSDKTFAALERGNSMFYGCTSLTTIDLSSATFNSLTEAMEMFYGCNALTSIDLSNKTFGALINANEMFRNCTSLTTIDLSAAIFGSLTATAAMFYGCSSLTSIIWPNADLSKVRTITGGGGSPNGMFRGCNSLTSIPFNNMEWNEITNIGNVFNSCTSLQSINLSTYTFAKLQNAAGAFENCTSLTSIDFSAATFAQLTNSEEMFKNDTALTTITFGANLNFNNLQRMGGWNGNTSVGMFENCQSLTTINGIANQTFPSAIVIGNMFKNCTSLTNISLPNATFANATQADGMFANCLALTTIDLSSATFAKITQVWMQVNEMLRSCNALTTISVPTNSTAISTSATTANAAIDAHWSDLSYQSMLNIANWINDFTGYTSPTLTFNSTAFNALSAAEQANIQGIVTGKNWTLALA